MDYRREDLTYRRINRLAAAQLAGACILVLTIAIVAILQNARLRRESNRIEDRLSAADERLGTLEAQVAALQRSETARIERERAAVETVTPPEPAPTGSDTGKPARRPRRSTPPDGGPPESDATRLLAIRTTMGTPSWDADAARLALRALDTAAVAGQEITADAAFAAAELAAATGDDDAAIHWADLAIDTGHADGAAAQLLAEVYLRRGFFAEARAHAEGSVEACVDAAKLPDRLWLLARIALAQRDDLAATAALDRLLGTSNTGDDPALLSAAAAAAGALALDRGETRQARRLLELAEATDRANPALRRLAARVLFAEGNWSAAAEKAAGVLTDHADDLEMLTLLGPALVRADRPREAVEPLRAWTTAAPRDAEAHDWLGTALLALRQPTDAVAAFDQALRLAPSAALYHRRGIGLLNAGDLTAAIDSFQAAIELDEVQALPHFALAVCLARTGDADGAERALQRALALDGSLMEEAAEIDALARVLAGMDGAGPGGPPTVDAEPR